MSDDEARRRKKKALKKAMKKGTKKLTKGGARRLRQLPAFCVCAAGFGFGGSTFGAAPSRTCALRCRASRSPRGQRAAAAHAGSKLELALALCAVRGTAGSQHGFRPLEGSQCICDGEARVWLLHPVPDARVLRIA